ncbi:DUF7289 family protein [Halorubrum sp. AS12]|uniref:DUF7289 family protein n=1 Tax=Halorubrum sp. AS12 TaxID=3409687 RepID=UPI003DA72A87
MRGADRGAGFRSADRGVSETVGFVLVFALIATTIAVTFTVGLGGLEDAQLAERDNNVERAFDVLHDNFNDLSRDGAPSRATELRLGGGELAFADDSTYRIYNESNDSVEGSTTAIVYRGAGETEIRYEHGAVIRSDGGGSVMLQEPDVLFGETTLIGLVALGPRGTESVGGDRTVLVRGAHPDDGTVTEVSENVTIRIEARPPTLGTGTSTTRETAPATGRSPTSPTPRPTTRRG